jgi:NAD-dependent SIR2 family protein deacetylase
VSAIPCSCHRTKHPGKLAVAYWAWFLADGSRSAWKVRYCLDGAEEHLKAILAASQELRDSMEVFACTSCGASAESDSDPIYCTLYLPRREPMEVAVQLCAACAAKLRIPIVEMGARLPDRMAGMRGPSSATTAWDVLGLAPD